MTMPHLMNCSHSEDGWCLECVKTLWDECDSSKTLLQQVLDGNKIGAVWRSLARAIISGGERFMVTALQPNLTRRVVFSDCTLPEAIRFANCLPGYIDAKVEPQAEMERQLRK